MPEFVITGQVTTVTIIEAETESEARKLWENEPWEIIYDSSKITDVEEVE